MAYSETSKESWKTVYYYINNKEVSVEEFQQYCVVQDNKEDTEWYEFTLENIETYVK